MGAASKRLDVLLLPLSYGQSLNDDGVDDDDDYGDYNSDEDELDDIIEIKHCQKVGQWKRSKRSPGKQANNQPGIKVNFEDHHDDHDR